ncbi:hypothetical protein ACFOY2_45820 [Nonomuraea purpurea]|uniref:Uncharacterized protein n=1 Tax=Nonomuraea purpurea TaxID=1849276 RepID=A0ABV8GNK7_9ACTN
MLGEAGEWKPGRIVARPDVDGDGDTGPGIWVLAVDASWWPIAAADQVAVQGGGQAWAVIRASLRPSDFDPAIDYIRVEASPADV